MRYKGRMSKQVVRTNWPHAVVVEATALHGLKVDLSGPYPSICHVTESITDDRARSFVVLRFRDAGQAELFRRRAHGEFYDPSDERWRR